MVVAITAVVHVVTTIVANGTLRTSRSIIFGWLFLLLLLACHSYVALVVVVAIAQRRSSTIQPQEIVVAAVTTTTATAIREIEELTFTHGFAHGTKALLLCLMLLEIV